MTTTPAHVLEAGKKERERYEIVEGTGIEGGCLVLDAEGYAQYGGDSYEQCQDFIDDRIYQAMRAAEREG